MPAGIDRGRQTHHHGPPSVKLCPHQEAQHQVSGQSDEKAGDDIKEGAGQGVFDCGDPSVTQSQALDPPSKLQSQALKHPSPTNQCSCPCQNEYHTVRKLEGDRFIYKVWTQDGLRLWRLINNVLTGWQHKSRRNTFSAKRSFCLVRSTINIINTGKECPSKTSGA